MCKLSYEGWSLRLMCFRCNCPQLVEPGLRKLKSRAQWAKLYLSHPIIYQAKMPENFFAMGGEKVTSFSAHPGSMEPILCTNKWLFIEYNVCKHRFHVTSFLWIWHNVIIYDVIHKWFCNSQSISNSVKTTGDDHMLYLQTATRFWLSCGENDVQVTCKRQRRTCFNYQHSFTYFWSMYKNM